MISGSQTNKDLSIYYQIQTKQPIKFHTFSDGHEVICNLINQYNLSPPPSCRVYASLQWRHNDHVDVSNHQPHGCLLNRLQTQIKENIKAPRHWPLCGEFTGAVNSPHKGPVTRKLFPFDDVVMLESGRIWLRSWLAACSAPSHYRNQC